jgi:hypothetical protein
LPLVIKSLQVRECRLRPGSRRWVSEFGRCLSRAVTIVPNLDGVALNGTCVALNRAGPVHDPAVLISVGDDDGLVEGVSSLGGITPKSARAVVNAIRAMAGLDDSATHVVATAEAHAARSGNLGIGVCGAAPVLGGAGEKASIPSETNS